MDQYFDPVRSFKCVHKQDKYVEIFGIISYGYCWAIIGLYSPGGHWPRKVVWGCAAVMTPFFQATRRSLAYQFTIIVPL